MHGKASTTAGGLAPLLAVQGEPGELEALGLLAAGRSTDPVVLVELVNGAGDRQQRLVSRLAEAAVQAVRARRPLWIDTTWLPESVALDGVARWPLGYLDEQVRLALADPRIPPLIPVLGNAPSDGVLNRVRMLRDRHARQLVIRSRRDPWLARRDLVGQILRIARVTGVPTRSVHVVLDEGLLPPVTPERVDDLLHSVQVLTNRIGPASIGLLAGSASQGDADTGEQRRELQLWQAISAGSPVPVRYGDYGTGVAVPRLEIVCTPVIPASTTSP
jgi:phenylpyruvate tautomerase PptA (4-oxalocrotonate tautomerase family)